MTNTVRQSGNYGARFDLAVRAGADLETHSVQLFQDAAQTQAFSLSGCTVQAWCRVRDASGLGAVTQFDVAIADAPNGKISLDMSAAKTALLPRPAYTTSPPEVLDWWLQVTDSSAKVVPIFFGEYEVRA
jgi:hypothetical protein